MVSNRSNQSIFWLSLATTLVSFAMLCFFIGFATFENFMTPAGIASLDKVMHLIKNSDAFVGSASILKDLQSISDEGRYLSYSNILIGVLGLSLVLFGQFIMITYIALQSEDKLPLPVMKMLGLSGRKKFDAFEEQAIQQAYRDMEGVSSALQALEQQAGSLNEYQPSDVGGKQTAQKARAIVEFNAKLAAMREVFKQSTSSVEQIRSQFPALVSQANEISNFSQASKIEWQAFNSGLRNFQVSISQLGENISNLQAKVRDSSKAVSDSLKLESAIYSRANRIKQAISALVHHAKTDEELIDVISDEVNASKSDVTGASDLVNQFSERASEIVNIIDVIDDIAEQTNLLALNASIEAARAGEQGKGFAVVADEVRILAARSSTATRSITELLTKIQADAEHASNRLTKSTESVGVAYNSIDKFAITYKKSIEEAKQAQGELTGLFKNFETFLSLVSKSQMAHISIENHVSLLDRDMQDRLLNLQSVKQQANSVINSFNRLSKQIVRQQLTTEHVKNLLDSNSHIQDALKGNTDADLKVPEIFMQDEVNRTAEKGPDNGSHELKASLRRQSEVLQFSAETLSRLTLQSKAAFSTRKPAAPEQEASAVLEIAEEQLSEAVAGSEPVVAAEAVAEESANPDIPEVTVNSDEAK